MAVRLTALNAGTSAILASILRGHLWVGGVHSSLIRNGDMRRNQELMIYKPRRVNRKEEGEQKIGSRAERLFGDDWRSSVLVKTRLLALPAAKLRAKLRGGYSTRSHGAQRLHQ